MGKELYGIENYIDLSGKRDELAEEKLRAYICGDGMNLSIVTIHQDNANFSTTISIPIVPPEQINQATSILPPTKKHVVLLVHGIRTRASWLEMVAVNLEEKDSIEVIPLRYGYFATLQFWFPFFTRKKPIERVLREIRTVQSSHRDAHLSIIAHSFGTYAVAKILEDNPDIQIYRLILCGSVLNANFRWDKIHTQIEGISQQEMKGVINECGTRDIWPILAQIGTWGYGAVGSFGFGSAAKVQDRFHNNDHGDYFSEQFVKDYWRPFIKDGQIVPSKWDISRPVTPWWMSFLSIMPLQNVILVTLLLLIFLAGRIIFHY
ncbi:MAG: hypothetical protein ACRDHZ_02025 [Ktedonobacteraceae bacterium]